MSVTIYEIRNETITANIVQEESQVTSYVASNDMPITLIHEAHVQLLQDKLAELTGKPLTRDDFLSLLELGDTRAKSAE